MVTDISSWEIKLIIREYMAKNKISYRELSHKTNIQMYKLMYILLMPFSRVKLTQGVAISRALGTEVSKLFDIQIDIHCANQI